MTPTRWMSLADPIHGIIRFNRENETHKLLLAVMNTPAFQRLRRIRQMGMAEFVFPGATHSRFVHSLGATHLMMQLIRNLKNEPSSHAILNASYADTGVSHATLLLLGILLHDVGHPPLSHTLEDILDLKPHRLDHESWGARILREDPDLAAVWQRHNPSLPEALLRFLGDPLDGAPADKHFLAQLVSSQLDMDRLDYLQRDSHYLGVQYGRVEAERIVMNLTLEAGPHGQPVVAVREEALPAVEHYLFGRFQAYKMALHSLDKASESLLKLVLQRFRWVRDNGGTPGRAASELYRLISADCTLSVPDYLRMDDCYLWEVIHSWSIQSEDALLRSLADRLMRHDLLKFVEVSRYGLDDTALERVREQLKAHYAQRGLSWTFGFDETEVKPKSLYQPAGAREPIWVKTDHGVCDLREVTSLPLTVEADQGQKRLWFLWDGECKYTLTQLLKQAR